MQYQGVHSIVPGGSFGISGALVHRLVRMASGITQRWLDAKVAGVSRDRWDGPVVEPLSVWHRDSTAGYAPFREEMMSRVVGADVWKNGWIAVVTVRGWIASMDAYDTMADLATSESDAEVIAVDIPIGLPVAPPRPADSAARHFIGARSSSVFPTPPRDVLEAETYQDALRLSRKRYGVGLTAQSYALRRRILETDKVARSDERLIEIHPEVTFRALAGKVLQYGKKSWNGHAERRRLLSGVGLSLPDRLPDAVGTVPADDVLDAAAGAWTAARFAAGEAKTLPEEIPLPGFGEVIWY